MITFDIFAIVLFVIVVSIIIWLNITSSLNNINSNNINKQEMFTSTQLPINDFKNIINEIKFSNNDIVEYGNYICHKKQSQSINNNNQLKFSNNNRSHTTVQLNKACDSSSNTENKHTSTKTEYIGDPALYYQMMYSKIPTKFDDGKFAGYNYYSFPGFGGIKNIGQIPLQKTNSYPIGINN